MIKSNNDERTRVGLRVTISRRGQKRIFVADYHHGGQHRRRSLKTTVKKEAVRKAMALEHLLKREESRVTGYTLIQMEYEDGKFRQVCDEVNERLREWFKQHRPDTYHAILEKHGRTQEGGNG